VLRDCVKDYKNKIQGFFAHQKDWAEQEAAINPHRHGQQNASKVQTKCRHCIKSHQHYWQETTFIAKWADLK